MNKRLNKLNLEVTDLETQVGRASVEAPSGQCFLQLSTQVGCGNNQDHLVSLRRSSQSVACGIAPARPSWLLRPSSVFPVTVADRDGRLKPGALQGGSPELQCGRAGSFPLLLWLLLRFCRQAPVFLHL